MDKSGRMFDIWFEEAKTPRSNMTVYADAGMKDIIVSVEGVRACYNILDSITYSVYLDPRYDRDVVKRRIMEAVTGKSAPEPTPVPDAEKVKSLIDEISDEAYNLGFHRAYAATAPKHSALWNFYTCLANRALNKCIDAHIALRGALGIEEE